MWKSATLLFASCMIATMVLTEVARSIVHRRRARRDEIVTTQDIAIVGLAIASVFLLATIFCAIMWLSR